MSLYVSSFRTAAVFVSTCICVALLLPSASARGSVLELCDKTFDKIVDGSRHVVVAFVEFSYKDQQIWDAVGDEFASADNVLVTKVATRENPDISKRFKLTDQKEPTVKFFPKHGHKFPIEYSGVIDSKQVITFVDQQLSPQLSELKTLADRFMRDHTNVKHVADADKLAKQLTAPHQGFGKQFIATMKHVQTKGIDFVKKEKKRLEGLIDNKSTTKTKKTEFQRKLQVVDIFDAAHSGKSTKPSK